MPIHFIAGSRPSRPYATTHRIQRSAFKLSAEGFISEEMPELLDFAKLWPEVFRQYGLVVDVSYVRNCAQGLQRVVLKHLISAG